MSTVRGDRTRALLEESVLLDRPFRVLALAGTLLLIASLVAILQSVTAVVGGTRSLVAVALGSLAVATLLARAIRPRTAVLLAVATGALSFATYLTVAGVGVAAVFLTTETFVSDTVALATGMGLLQMVEAGVWAIAFAPAPAFLTWYLALRGRYVAAVVPGGLALLFLVLSGDATLLLFTLLGTLGAIAAVGFGELEARGGSLGQADVLAICLALMLALSLSVSLVPAGTGGPTILVEGDGHDGTLEGTMTTSPDRTTITGSVDLSPEVRFTIRSEEPSYWRTGVYDRYTGDGWLRTGQAEAYVGPIPEPPGETETVRQTVFVETETAAVMPTAPQPIDVEGEITENTLRTTHDQFRPDEPLIEGDAYNVVSAVVDASPAELREAGTDYPEAVTERYLQRPEGLSSAFDDRTAETVTGAQTPYEKAVAIEAHLRESKGYSLDVTRPDGDPAEAFLLEMDAGYCVYFATTMTQMLRAEDVPARYVTGYTTGQQVDDNEWVVRGLNAHAWVEVYFPDHGWVAFDPTPGGERDAVHYDALEDARAAGTDGVDTARSEPLSVPRADLENRLDRLANGSGNVSPDFPTEPDANGAVGPTAADPRAPADLNGSAGGQSDPTSIGETGETPDDGSDATGAGDDRRAEDGDDEGGSGITPENAALGTAILLGLAAGAHRTGATARVSREATLQWQGVGRRSPNQDAERAYRRLELLLARRYRPRRPAESSRQYLASIDRFQSLDERAHRVQAIYERATHGDGISRAAADEAVAIVDSMARRRLPIVGRRWRR